MNVTSPNPYRIVLADKYDLFREGLKKILSEKADMQVVGEANDGPGLLNLLDQLALNRLAPHLVILDISSPNLLGIEAVRRVKMTYPEVKVLMMGMHDDAEYCQHALSCGAHGYLTKTEVNAKLPSAVETVRQGGVYVSTPRSQE